jgi:hypothetical protein
MPKPLPEVDVPPCTTELDKQHSRIDDEESKERSYEPMQGLTSVAQTSLANQSDTEAECRRPVLPRKAKTKSLETARAKHAKGKVRRGREHKASKIKAEAGGILQGESEYGTHIVSSFYQVEPKSSWRAPVAKMY